MLQNQGKHSVNLVWVNTTFAAVKSKQAKAQKKGSNDRKVQLHSGKRIAHIDCTQNIE